jgi:hypothetical protein
MSNEQQYISPEQQQQLFDTLKQHGLLSKDIGQSSSASDTDAQSGVGNIDINTLQSLIKHASNPNAVAMQEGDKMHPMDAIQQITQKLNGGAAPAAQPNQNFLTPVQPQAPGHGVGSFLSKMITGHPLMHDAGSPIMGTTQAPDTSNLPSSMVPKPIGTDANGKPIFDYVATQKLQGQEGAMATALAKGAASNPKYDFQKLTAMGVPVKDAATLIAANPDGVPEKELAKYQTQTKNTVFSAMVDIKKDMVKTMQQRLVGMFEGPGALQQTMKDSAQRSANIDRFYGVYQTVANQGFEATQVQRNLLQTEAARVITGSGGVITDDSYNRLASGTAQQKVSDWKAWLMNEATPADFKSFADQLKTLMDNEYQVNQSIFAIGQKASAHILGNSPPAAYTPNSAPVGVPKPTTTLTPTGGIADPKAGKVRVLNIQTGQVGYVSKKFSTDPKYKVL